MWAHYGLWQAEHVLFLLNYVICLIDEAEDTVDRTQLDTYVRKKRDKQGLEDKYRLDKGKTRVSRFQKGEIVVFKN